MVLLLATSGVAFEHVVLNFALEEAGQTLVSYGRVLGKLLFENLMQTAHFFRNFEDVEVVMTETFVGVIQDI